MFAQTLASVREPAQKAEPRHRRQLRAAALAGTGLLGVGMGATSAKADFSGPYDVMNFTLTNTDADGSVDTSGAPNSIVLTGGNDSSFLQGTTDFTTIAVADGTVSFNWGYISSDYSDYDGGGFLLNGVYTELANNDTQVPFFDGTFSTTVSAGDIFGFRVRTTDNLFAPGQFGVSNFSGPRAVPEPGSLALLALGVAGGALAFRRGRATAETTTV